MTICMVCKGTGMVQLSNFPTSTGGRMNERYIMSGIECGAHGSGRISMLRMSVNPLAVNGSPGSCLRDPPHYPPESPPISLSSARMSNS